MYLFLDILLAPPNLLSTYSYLQFIEGISCGNCEDLLTIFYKQFILQNGVANINVHLLYDKACSKIIGTVKSCLQADNLYSLNYILFTVKSKYGKHEYIEQSGIDEKKFSIDVEAKTKTVYMVL